MAAAARAAPGGLPRYVGLRAALLEALRELGGEAELGQLLLHVWRRYGPGSRVRVVMRLYPRPGGGYWSPDAEEALHALEAMGLIERRNGTIKLRR